MLPERDDYMKNELNVICSEEHAHTCMCVSPREILIALKDAKETMSYSNWANDKFDRVAEILFRYCEEHNIPMEFKEELI